jgi:prepilin signal peptidase PulO-like enzyme (type II secretory pathway)
MIFDAKGTILFILWLIYLIGFIALGLYDLKWYLLPNRIIFPLYIVAFVQITVLVLFFDLGMQGLLTQIGAILIGGGIFYILYQISNGKWIGGGDVKLGFLIGAILGKPMLSILFIFIASLVGTLFAVPLLIRGSLKRSSHLPFGPFLLISAFIVVLFGDSLANGYLRIVGL